MAKLFEQLRALKEEGADIDQMLDDQEESMREVLTGTTTDSIVDSILRGFAEGKRSAKDFADDFQKMLNNAVLQGIKMKALEEPLRQWYESFAAASGNGLTAENIASTPLFRNRREREPTQSPARTPSTRPTGGLPRSR